MATHNDTAKLLPYNNASYPSLKDDGGEARFITNELNKISNAVASMIAVMKLLESRMNTNGLT